MPEHPFHQEVGLADHLHVAVLDAVVDHLDEMSRPVRPDPLAAGAPSSAFAEIFWNIGFTRGQASGFPPGMMAGPRRAPSSPPLTPVPM